MAAGASLPVTLHAVCRLAEAADDGLSTSILLLDHTGSRILRGFGPSLPPSYVSAFDGWPIGLGIGPCAEAAHLGEQIVSLNLAADERWTPEFRRLASAHELRACWSTPIQSSEGRMLGSFAVYPDKCAGPTLEQKSRIERLTHLASLAIEHAQSLDALRRSDCARLLANKRNRKLSDYRCFAAEKQRVHLLVFCRRIGSSHKIQWRRRAWQDGNLRTDTHKVVLDRQVDSWLVGSERNSD